MYTDEITPPQSSSASIDVLTLYVVSNMTRCEADRVSGIAETRGRDGYTSNHRRVVVALDRVSHLWMCHTCGMRV